MKFRIQITKTITLKEELEVECENENILDNVLDDIDESDLEGTEDLINTLINDGIKVTEYQEDGSRDVEIDIENVYSVDDESEED
jgi:hypothetical protein